MSRAHSTVRYASRVTGVPFEKYLVWGGIAAAIYFVVWPVLKTAISVKGAVDAGITTARDALASGLYRVFGPEEKFGSDRNSIITFPDGKRHSIPAEAISSDGVFVNRWASDGSPYSYAGDGKTYRVLINNSTGARVAQLI